MPPASRSRNALRTRACPTCLTTFEAQIKSRKIACSAPCAAELRAEGWASIREMWDGEGSKVRIARERRERASRVQPIGVAAAKLSPRSGRFETNINASVWIVIDPTGYRREVRNLRLWCEHNADLFAPHPWRNAYAGLRQVAKWLRGKSDSQISTWRGWSLADIPTRPVEHGWSISAQTPPARHPPADAVVR
ncbi:hypothetical protein ACERNI_10875 [Camelimonas sp. ID_303_24]